MDVEAAVAIWIALASSVYLFFAFLGSVKAGDLVGNFRQTYVNWFYKIFFRKGPYGKKSVSLLRVFIISSLTNLIVIFLLYNYSGLFHLRNEFAKMIHPILHDDGSHQIGLYILKYAIAPAFLVSIMLNTIFDYLSIQTSLKLGSRFSENLWYNASLTMLDVSLTFIIAAVSVVIIFFIGANLYIFVYSTVYETIQFRLVVPGALLFSGLADYIQLRNELLTEGHELQVLVVRYHPTAPSQFASTFLTTVWLVLFFMLQLIMRTLNRVFSLEGNLKKHTRPETSWSVIGGLYAFLISVVYWIFFLLS